MTISSEAMVVMSCVYNSLEKCSRKMIMVLYLLVSVLLSYTINLTHMLII